MLPEGSVRHPGQVAALEVPEAGAAQAGSGAEVAVAVAAFVPAAARRKGDAVRRWARSTVSATW